MGVPINQFMAIFYEWLFIVAGPTAIVFGAVSIASGFWIGTAWRSFHSGRTGQRPQTSLHVPASTGKR